MEARVNSWEKRVALVLAAACAEYELFAEGALDAETALRNIRGLLTPLTGPSLSPEQRQQVREKAGL